MLCNIKFNNWYIHIIFYIILYFYYIFRDHQSKLLFGFKLKTINASKLEHAECKPSRLEVLGINLAVDIKSSSFELFAEKVKPQQLQ